MEGECEIYGESLYWVGYLVYNEMENRRDADLNNVLPESLKTDISERREDS